MDKEFVSMLFYDPDKGLDRITNWFESQGYALEQHSWLCQLCRWLWCIRRKHLVLSPKRTTPSSLLQPSP